MNRALGNRQRDEAKRVVRGNFSEANPNFSKFYRRAAVFSAAFLPASTRRQGEAGRQKSGKRLFIYISKNILSRLRYVSKYTY